MIYIFLFFPLVLFLISSYMFNIRKIHDGKFYIIFLSILEAILSFLFIVMFFSQGYLPRFLYWSLSFFALLLGCLFFFFIHREDDDQWDIQLETIKNNILVFFKTLLPLYFFLIIFRFWNPVLQIVTALVLTLLLNLLAIFLRGLLAEPFKVFFRKLGMSSIVSSLWLWVIIIVIVAFNFLFQLPVDRIKSAFNLNDNAAYLVYDEMPVDIQNNFKQKTLYSIKLENNIDGSIIDYYYDSEYLYLYTTRSELLVISNETEGIIFRTQIEGTQPAFQPSDYQYSEYYDYFLFYDEKLLLFDTYGIYQVTPTSITELLPISSVTSKHFSINDELWLLEQTNATTFLIYQYANNTFTLDETVNTTLKSYDSLLVISDNLFQKTDTELILDSNEAIRFPYKAENNIVYDSVNEIMYYSIFLSPDGTLNSVTETKTIYEKVTSIGETSSITIKNQHSIDLAVYNDNLLVAGFDTLEVVDQTFEFSAIFDHIEVQAFLKTNKYTSVNYNNFNVIDESTIEFIQEQSNKYTIVLQINQLVEEDNPLQLPFYTHYGFLTIIPILLGCLFELTDYRKSTSELSFKSQVIEKREG